MEEAVRAFWFTWSPKGYPIEDLRRTVRAWERRKRYPIEWSAAAHRQMRTGDRAYLFKQGHGRRGIFGIGRLVGEPSPDASWRGNGRQTYYAPILFDHLVDPEKSFLIPLQAIEDIIPANLIVAMSSGYVFPENKANELDRRIHLAILNTQNGYTPDDWKNDELGSVVNAYFNMLRSEVDGRRYRRADFNDKVQRATGRSEEQVDFKFANVSAVLDDMGLRWIKGYKPRGNGQAGAIKDGIEAYLDNHQGFAERLEPVRETMPKLPSALTDIFTDPPPKTEPKPPTGRGKVMPKRDRAASDARNRLLGEQGESYVFKLEQRRLTKEGRRDLATQVIWTAQDEGDGAGYDIASFNADGSTRYIEVKTTNGGPETPFYITANELRVSENAAAAFSLYRVYWFSKEPRIYCLRGSLKASAMTLEAKVFQVSP